MKMRINESLRVLRNRKGLSQGDMAMLIGVSNRTLLNIETGLTSPRLSQIEAIVKACGETLTFTFGEES